MVILLLIVFAKSHYDMENVIKAHEVSENSLKTQIEELQNIHQKELKRRDDAIERYKTRNEELEGRYQEALDKLAAEIDKRKDRVIRNFKEDKGALRVEIEQTYGFDYVH